MMLKLAVRLCALAVLFPVLKPMTRPVARWMLKQLEGAA